MVPWVFTEISLWAREAERRVDVDRLCMFARWV